MKFLTFLLRLPFDEAESFSTLSTSHLIPIPTVLAPVRFVGWDFCDTPVSSVPELSSGALMIVGLVAIGFLKRRFHRD